MELIQLFYFQWMLESTFRRGQQNLVDGMVLYSLIPMCFRLSVCGSIFCLRLTHRLTCGSGCHFQSNRRAYLLYLPAEIWNLLEGLICRLLYYVSPCEHLSFCIHCFFFFFSFSAATDTVKSLSTLLVLDLLAST